jgi:Rrf2 family protein
MKLQKNTLLALYSVIEFAADPARHISVAEIADRHGVSAHHLAKVLSELARAGVVESVRGVGGGYRFAGNSRRLTLMDIIELFEDFEPRAGARNPPDARTRRPDNAAAARDDSGIHAARAVDRALGAVLSEIDEIAKATFRSITLATMLQLILRQQRGATAPTQRKNRVPRASAPGNAHPRKRNSVARRKPA